jgi:hypothetical protein
LNSNATLRTKSNYQRSEAGQASEAFLELGKESDAINLSGYIFDTVSDEIGLPFPGCT